MAEVERQGCSTCPSVYIVFDEDLGETCPRCERNRLREEVATLREQMKVDYWEKVSAENARLHDQISRLQRRGIEDLTHENEQLHELRKAALQIVANYESSSAWHAISNALEKLTEALGESS